MGATLVKGSDPEAHGDRGFCDLPPGIRPLILLVLPAQRVLDGGTVPIEAIFITGFLLISNNRQSAHADKRAELDYEVNVRTYRHIHQIDTRLRAIGERLERLEADVRKKDQPG
jgi:hypothetical protein